MDGKEGKDTVESASNISEVDTPLPDVANPVDETIQNESQYSSYYKYNYKSPELSQEQRREQLLECQKQQRHDVVDANRTISDVFENLCESDYESGATQTFLSRNKNPRYSLMMTEWMREIPSDYPQNWLAKFCPDGHRNLLVAIKNVTKCYSRGGIFQFQFLSNLPDGGRSTSTFSNKITVLDTICDEKKKIFFILDVIAWNGVPFYSYEADCRFFCLKSRFEELTPLKGITQKYKIHLLDHIGSDPSLIHEKMNNLLRIEDHDFLYDGVLFYHKKSQYVFHETPLVLWLKSYMIPEMLNLSILDNYTQRRPKKYVNMQSFLEYKQNKKDKSKQRPDEMDTL